MVQDMSGEGNSYARSSARDEGTIVERFHLPCAWLLARRTRDRTRQSTPCMRAGLSTWFLAGYGVLVVIGTMLLTQMLAEKWFLAGVRKMLRPLGTSFFGSCILLLAFVAFCFTCPSAATHNPATRCLAEVSGRTNRTWHRSSVLAMR
jgi:hypothetical protein